MPSKVIEIGYGNVKKVKIGGGGKLVLIGGPCAIENRAHAFMMAERIGEICEDLNVDWIYKWLAHVAAKQLVLRCRECRRRWICTDLV